MDPLGSLPQDILAPLFSLYLNGETLNSCRHVSTHWREQAAEAERRKAEAIVDKIHAGPLTHTTDKSLKDLALVKTSERNDSYISSWVVCNERFLILSIAHKNCEECNCSEMEFEDDEEESEHRSNCGWCGDVAQEMYFDWEHRMSKRVYEFTIQRLDGGEITCLPWSCGHEWWRWQSRYNDVKGENIVNFFETGFDTVVSNNRLIILRKDEAPPFILSVSEDGSTLEPVEYDIQRYIVPTIVEDTDFCKLTQFSPVGDKADQVLATLRGETEEKGKFWNTATLHSIERTPEGQLSLNKIVGKGLLNQTVFTSKSQAPFAVTDKMTGQDYVIYRGDDLNNGRSKLYLRNLATRKRILLGKLDSNVVNFQASFCGPHKLAVVYTAEETKATLNHAIFQINKSCSAGDKKPTFSYTILKGLPDLEFPDKCVLTPRTFFSYGLNGTTAKCGQQSWSNSEHFARESNVAIDHEAESILWLQPALEEDAVLEDNFKTKDDVIFGAMAGGGLMMITKKNPLSMEKLDLFCDEQTVFYADANSGRSGMFELDKELQIIHFLSSGLLLLKREECFPFPYSYVKSKVCYKPLV